MNTKRENVASQAVEFPQGERNTYTLREDDAVEKYREDLLQEIREAGDNEVVYADLGGVTLGSSCIDETIVPALKEIRRSLLDKSKSRRYMVIRDPAGRSDWDADAALRKASEETGSKLIVVWKTDQQVELLGPVDEQVRATYEFLQDRPGHEATTREMADAYDITIQAANNRMNRAVKAGIVRKISRKSVQGGGTQNVYVSVE